MLYLPPAPLHPHPEASEMPFFRFASLFDSDAVDRRRQEILQLLYRFLSSINLSTQILNDLIFPQNLR